MISLKIFLIAVTASLAGEVGPPKWEPMPMNEIRAVYESKTLSDKAIVDSLVGHLDKRITMARVPGTKHRPSPGGEYATLIGLIAERPFPAKPRGRPEAIRAAIGSLAAEIQNKDEVKSFLSIALTLAGDPPSSEVIDLLNRESTPREVVVAALNKYAQGNTPIAALPVLVSRAGDSWSYIRSEGVGPQNPRRVFPIREAVKRNLDVLGVAVKERKEIDASPDKAGKKFETVHLDIDRKSLANRLREATKSRDAVMKKQAIEAAGRIGGSDMKAVVDEAAKDNGK